MNWPKSCPRLKSFCVRRRLYVAAAPPMALRLPPAQPFSRAQSSRAARVPTEARPNSPPRLVPPHHAAACLKLTLHTDLHTLRNPRPLFSSADLLPQTSMVRSLKLAVATHLLLWSLCSGTPTGVSGE